MLLGFAPGAEKKSDDDLHVATHRGGVTVKMSVVMP